MRLRHRVAIVGCALVIGACGNGSSVDSSAEAAAVIKRAIAEHQLCGEPGGRVECTAVRGGWQCTFGVTRDGFAGTAFVGHGGGNVHAMTIC